MWILFSPLFRQRTQISGDRSCTRFVQTFLCHQNSQGDGEPWNYVLFSLFLGQNYDSIQGWIKDLIQVNTIKTIGLGKSTIVG